MNSLELTRNTRRKIGEAIHDFSLIREGDRLMVGFSGGKDSLILLFALKALQSRSPVRFELEACTVDPTEGQADLEPLSRTCSSLGVPLTVITVPIFRLIAERSESHPCSFCANMRRGALSTFTREKGFTTLCLGHHLDDVVETTLLSLFFAGKFHCFSPLTWQDRSETRVIRPLIYLEEAQVELEAGRLGFPILDSSCPFSSESRRAWVKAQVKTMSTTAKELRFNILHALRTGGLNGWDHSLRP
jgi:tRNA(Ile)-lysidine synthase TilS/MesJ